jgi:hypothetical protein
MPNLFLFSAPLFHIGSDETFELGRGQSQARAKEVGLGRIYLEHLKRVSEIMKPYNKRLMFWGTSRCTIRNCFRFCPRT